MTDANNIQAHASDGQINMGKWLRKGWDHVFSDAGFYILAALIFIVVAAIASSTIIGEFVIVGPLIVGFYYVILQKVRGKPVQLGDLSKGFDFFAAAALSNILITFLISIGLIFCIIPAIIVAALYLFTPIFIVEKNMDFWQAMEASRRLVSKHLFELSVFALLLAIITIIGALLCVVGLLVTTPLIFAATAYAYDDLVGIERE